MIADRRLRIAAPWRRRGAVLAITICTGAFGTSFPAAPLFAQQATAAVRAGTLIDGTGAAPVRNAVIVIQNGRITSVGPNLTIPRGAHVIDLSAMTVLPGFIDAHVHLTGPVLGEPGWENAALRESAADAALRGAKHARESLMAGFTTVRNVGAGRFADVALRDAINAGRVSGPRMQTAAELLGWESHVGTVQAGRHADLVAVTGDPLSDVAMLENVQWVMKGGEVVKGSRQ